MLRFDFEERRLFFWVLKGPEGREEAAWLGAEKEVRSRRLESNRGWSSFVDEEEELGRLKL